MQDSISGFCILHKGDMMFSETFRLHHWQMKRDNKEGAVLRFKGTHAFARVVGKAAPRKDQELTNEIAAIKAIKNTPAYVVVQPYHFAGTVRAREFLSAFDPEACSEPFAVFSDPEELVDVLISRDFGKTLHQFLVASSDVRTPQSLDILCLRKIKLVIESTQILRACGFAHQDVKCDNVSPDGKLIDFECACGTGLPNRTLRRHPTGWKEFFENTTEDADVFSCIQSLYVYGGKRIQRLPLLSALRTKLFGLSGPETSRINKQGFPHTYLCGQKFEYVTHQGTIDDIDQILRVFDDDETGATGL